MPYNNTPIEPPTEFTGQSSLPLARVKKIIHADEDIGNCSNNAAFVITVATEMFIQYLVEQTHTVVKTERKPRRNIQYRDVANAVARIDNLEFLSDVVPKTIPYKKFKEDKAARDTAAKSAVLVNGQKALTGSSIANGGREDQEAEEAGDADEMLVDLKEGEIRPPVHFEPPQDDPAAMQLEMEMRGRPLRNGTESGDGQQ